MKENYIVSIHVQRNIFSGKKGKKKEKSDERNVGKKLKRKKEKNEERSIGKKLIEILQEKLGAAIYTLPLSRIFEQGTITG